MIRNLFGSKMLNDLPEFFLIVIKIGKQRKFSIVIKRFFHMSF